MLISADGVGLWRSSALSINEIRMTVILRITSTRHREADDRGEAATVLSTKFWARNHSALEHIDFVIGHGRSAVPLSSTRLHPLSDTNFARGPVWQAGTRDALSCQDHHRSIEYHGPHLGASGTKVGMEHNFPGSQALLV